MEVRGIWVYGYNKEYSESGKLNEVNRDRSIVGLIFDKGKFILFMFKVVFRVKCVKRCDWVWV